MRLVLRLLNRGSSAEVRREPADGFLGVFEVQGWEPYDKAIVVVMPDEQGECEVGAGEYALDLLCPSPNLSRDFDFGEILWHVGLKNLAAGKTIQELAAFDRQVTQRYSEYQAEVGWYYMGSYRVTGEGFNVAEIEWVQGPSIDEAVARDAAHPLPTDVESMYAECRSYYAKPGVTFWLRPVELAKSLPPAMPHAATTPSG